MDNYLEEYDPLRNIGPGNRIKYSSAGSNYSYSVGQPVKVKDAHFQITAITLNRHVYERTGDISWTIYINGENGIPVIWRIIPGHMAEVIFDIL